MKSRSLLAGVMLLLPAAVVAQSQTTGTPKVELSLGAIAAGATSAGTTTAQLIDSSGQPVTLFEAEHRTTWAAGLEAGVGFRVSPRWSIDLSGSWARPDLQTRISDDVEDAPPVTATLGMHRFTVAVGATRVVARRGRLAPYVRVAAAWVRELTVDRALVDDGVAADVGSGLKYWVREAQSGWLGHVALRADVRLTVRRGGITLGETATRWSPSVSAGLVIAR
jgi:hypothetical protein